MSGENPDVVGIILCDKLVNEMESLYTFGEYLLLDLIKNLMRSIFPVHLFKYKYNN